jgi:hypothetical protein
MRHIDNLRGVDLLVLVLATIATLALALELRIKTVASQGEQTSGSSSPLAFQYQLLTPGLTGGESALLIIDSRPLATCREAYADPDAVHMMVIVGSSSNINSATRCSLGENPPTSAQPARTWAAVQAVMASVGARVVVVDPEGKVVYSSPEKILPTAVLHILRQPSNMILKPTS